MAENKTMVKDLTEGSIVRSLLTYAAPLFFANLLQAVYNVVDMIVVGQVDGGIGMAAVSIGGEILHLMTFLIMGFNQAGQVIISQYVGAKKHDSIVKMIATMFTLAFCMAVGIFIFCMIIGDAPLRWLNTDELAFSETHNYYMTCVFGLIFIYALCKLHKTFVTEGIFWYDHPMMDGYYAERLNVTLAFVFYKYEIKYARSTRCGCYLCCIYL